MCASMMAPGVTEIRGNDILGWVDPLSGLTHVRLEPVLTVTFPSVCEQVPQSNPFSNEKKDRKYVAIHFLLERTIQHARTSLVS